MSTTDNKENVLKAKCVHDMTKGERVMHVIKKILFFIFFFVRRNMKKGSNTNNDK